MTEVNPHNSTRVFFPRHEFRQAYPGLLTRPCAVRSLGFEAEFFLHNAQGIAAPTDCQTIVTSLSQRGQTASLEFAGIVEYPSRPFFEESVTSFSNLRFEPAITPVGTGFKLEPFVLDARRAYANIRDVAALQGFAVADTSHLADLTEVQAVSNVAPRPRALAGLQSMQRHALPGCRLLPLMNASVQTSLAVRDRDELFTTTEMGYLLTPFIYAAFANHPTRFNGQDCSTFHPRGKLYEDYGRQAGIAPAFLVASDASDFERRHVADILQTPLFFVSGRDGKIKVPEQQLPRYCDLPPELQTVSNFRLAQSFNYHDVKVCNIMAGDQVTGLRAEVRAFDTGRENMEIAPLFCALAILTPPVERQVRSLLADFGFAGQPRDYANRLLQARRDAIYHGGRYMDVPFGRHASGRAGRMLSFAAELGGILGQAVRGESEIVREAMAPLLERCASGVSPAQKLATSRAPVAA
jgi:hypothetical protein